MLDTTVKCGIIGCQLWIGITCDRLFLRSNAQMQAARATAFRRGTLSPTQWFWGLIAAFFFAATIHASIVLLFRFVSFPMSAFRHGYDFSFIPLGLKGGWHWWS